MAGLLAAVFVAGVIGEGCGTSPIGVDECRQLETARCQVASVCPNDLTVTDETQCELFYHDQCLHGLDVTIDPGQAAVDACEAAIRAAAACTSTTTACVSVINLYTNRGCEVVAHPELATACAFLAVGTAAATTSDAASEVLPPVAFSEELPDASDAAADGADAATDGME